ncbi:MAG: protein-glutamate O-methyltransferase CheR [Oscillospiraceae bacterium]|nr:protein-glutamate O-methyltransferase CheR [Oscillospiraceae bacterium]
MFKISEQDFQRLYKHIYDNFGIDLSKKKQLIEGRLYNTVVKAGFTGFTEYIDHVLKHNNSNEMEQVINKLTTNHTYFMRESSHFELFRDTILPELEYRKRNKVLGIWSAGCSSGEEPYTLSMILRDYFANKPGWDTRVLATDISHRVMNIAKAGVYEEESLKEIPNVWKTKYFKKDGHDYHLTPEIKNNVIFREFNLMDPINFKLKFDVIFCRNVMIYFDAQTKAALIDRFYNATANGGYLLIGHSETIDKSHNPYQYLRAASYKKTE